jgi:hypothetical protein
LTAGFEADGTDARFLPGDGGDVELDAGGCENAGVEVADVDEGAVASAAAKAADVPLIRLFLPIVPQKARRQARVAWTSLTGHREDEGVLT